MTPPVVHRLELVLPIPPSPNDWPSHPMMLHRAKNEYRRTVWQEVVFQEAPMADPPEKVVLSAHFYLHNLRDEDNLTASLKWALDALKQEQKGGVLWRQGIADRKGYFRDDDPAHLQLVKPTQEIQRDNPRLVITLMWRESQEAA